MSILEVHDLLFAYDDKQVLKNVNLSVEQGQIFCLVGPNGSGKTTLEHCILSHLKPDSGEILISGKEIGTYTPAELAEQLAYVPQSHTRSFPYKTVDVVAMGRVRKHRFMQFGGNDCEIAIKYMTQLGIEGLAEEEYSALSGGELQMVLIARALTQESSILVLDEPAAHLDVKRTQDILRLLAKIVKEQGKTVIMSTHDFNHPLMFQDEGIPVSMALMNGGVLSVAGQPLDMLSSGTLERVYGIKSRIVEINADRPRHYLATWSE